MQLFPKWLCREPSTALLVSLPLLGDVALRPMEQLLSGGSVSNLSPPSPSPFQPPRNEEGLNPGRPTLEGRSTVGREARVEQCVCARACVPLSVSVCLSVLTMKAPGSWTPKAQHWNDFTIVLARVVATVPLP